MASLIGELRVSAGADAGKMIGVADNAVLGRDTEADIVLHDREMSRRHARIKLVDGAAVLEDLGSTNGTFVNGEQLAGARALSEGDRIAVGDTTLVFTPAAPSPPPPPVAMPPRQTDGEPRII